jgi:hypothetical protein
MGGWRQPVGAGNSSENAVRVVARRGAGVHDCKQKQNAAWSRELIDGLTRDRFSTSNFGVSDSGPASN